MAGARSWRWRANAGSLAFVVLVMGGAEALAQDVGAEAASEARSAKAILADFARVPMPSFSRGNSPAAIKKFRDAIENGARRQADLAHELYVTHPEHSQVPRLLGLRWALMTNTLEFSQHVLSETQDIVQSSDRAELVAAAHLAASWASMHVDGIEERERLQLVELAIEHNPESELVAGHVAALVTRHLDDPERMRAIVDRGLAQWADNRWGGRDLKRVKRVLGQLGKPLGQSFGTSDANADAAAADLCHDEESGCTVVWMTSWLRDDAKARVAALKAMRERVPHLQVRTVRLHSGDADREELAAELAELGVDWPVHYEASTYPVPKDSWQRFVQLGYVLLDAEGRLVGFSERLGTLARRLAALRKPAVVR
ncbi:MAG: hypothetical protein NXI31_11110 [bacterium]|nr:hypothetical protein [bacterium]